MACLALNSKWRTWDLSVWTRAFLSGFTWDFPFDCLDRGHEREALFVTCQSTTYSQLAGVKHPHHEQEDHFRGAVLPVKLYRAEVTMRQHEKRQKTDLWTWMWLRNKIFSVWGRHPPGRSRPHSPYKLWNICESYPIYRIDIHWRCVLAEYKPDLLGNAARQAPTSFTSK